MMSVNANNGAQEETGLDNDVDKRVNKKEENPNLNQKYKMLTRSSKALNHSPIKEKECDSNDPINSEKTQVVENKSISERSTDYILPNLKWKGLSNRKHDIPNNLIEQIEELNFNDSDQNKSMNRETGKDKTEEHITENIKPEKMRQKASSFKDLGRKEKHEGAQKIENSPKDDASSAKIKSSNIGSPLGKVTVSNDQVTSSNKSATTEWPAEYITEKPSRNIVDANINLKGPRKKNIPAIGNPLRIEVKKLPTIKGSKKTHGATSAKDKSDGHTLTRYSTSNGRKVRHESRRGGSEISLMKQLEMEEKAAHKAVEDSGHLQTVQSDGNLAKFHQNIDSLDKSSEWRNYSSVDCIYGVKKKPKGIMNSLKASLSQKAVFKFKANSHKKDDETECSKQTKQSLTSLEFLDNDKVTKSVPTVALDKSNQKKVAESSSGSPSSLKRDICKKTQASTTTNPDKKSDAPITIRGAPKEPIIPKDVASNLLLEKRLRSAPNLGVATMGRSINASQRSLDSQTDSQASKHIFNSVNDTLSPSGYDDAYSPGSLVSSGSKLDQGDDKGGFRARLNGRSTGSKYRNNNNGRNISINDRRKSYERLMDFSSRKYSASRSRGTRKQPYPRYSEIKASYPRILGQFEKDLSNFLDYIEQYRSMTEPVLILWFKQLREIAIACQNTIKRDSLDPSFINDIMCTIEQMILDMSSTNAPKFEVIRPFFKRLSEVISAPARLVECLAVPYNDLYEKINCLQKNEPGQMLNFMKYLQSQTRNPFNYFDEKTSELIEKSDKHSANLRETPHREVANAAAPEKISMNDFKCLKRIRNGKFANIDLVQYKNSNIVCAMKTIRKKRFYFKNKIDKLFSERDIHVYLNSHFIANLFGTFTTEDDVCFVIEYISGGDLATYIDQGFHFHNDKIRDFTAQLVLAINFLHSKEIVHRDLKPENILMTGKFTLKLADFGLSDVALKYELTSLQEEADFRLVGTPYYMAPEVILNQSFGKSVDWWALGIIMYELFFDDVPFFGQTPEEIFNEIVTTEIKFDDSLETENNVPKDALDFISSLLVKDVVWRSRFLDIDIICKHAFFENLSFQEVEERMMQFSNHQVQISYSRISKIAHKVESKQRDSLVAAGVAKRGSSEEFDDRIKNFDFITDVFSEMIAGNNKMESMNSSRKYSDGIDISSETSKDEKLVKSCI